MNWRWCSWIHAIFFGFGENSSVPRGPSRIFIDSIQAIFCSNVHFMKKYPPAKTVHSPSFWVHLTIATLSFAKRLSPDFLQLLAQEGNGPFDLFRGIALGFVFNREIAVITDFS